MTMAEHPTLYDSNSLPLLCYSATIATNIINAQPTSKKICARVRNRIVTIQTFVSSHNYITIYNSRLPDTISVPCPPRPDHSNHLLHPQPPTRT
ncbi:skin secretory protein xP2 [Iris pallida]|uniref:Skin secretory protein xP2 n=1 Tax=Iris pallida TaxID=29817 RepID=A0AAX6HAZ2_IRIPA|nr:skin secretory protein xP2 [Iris pallida]